MKTTIYIAAIILAYAVASSLDYQIEAGMQAERSANRGGLHHAAR